MTDSSPSTFSVAALIAHREAERRKDREAAEAMQRKQAEELDTFRKRLEEFQVTDENIERVTGRIRRAFEQGESELMITSFPSAFCTDEGRAVNNADLPPLNPPKEGEPKPTEPAWLETLPKGMTAVYNYWKQHLEPGGFGFAARIINYPDGKPGDVGIFFTWPRSMLEQ